MIISPLKSNVSKKTVEEFLKKLAVSSPAVTQETNEGFQPTGMRKYDYFNFNKVDKSVFYEYYEQGKKVLTKINPDD